MFIMIGILPFIIKHGGGFFMKIKFKKRKLCVILMVLVSMVITACSASKRDESIAQNTAAMDYDYASSTVGFGNVKAKYSEEAKVEESMPQEAGTEQSLEVNKEEALGGRKLIKNVDLNVETLDFDKFIDLLEMKVSATGGYIENSNASNNSYQYNRLKYANYIVRIPSNRLDEFVSIVGENANIVDTSTSTEDVTLSYYDSESRKKALEIQQERLLALLEKAENIEDIIQLESRLSEVTYQLESQSTILRNYDNLVEYSRVSLYINEVERESQKAPETIGEKMKNGLTNTFYDIKEGAENFVVFLVVNLPYIIFWGVVICIIIVVLRKKRMLKLHKNVKNMKVTPSNESENDK